MWDICKWADMYRRIWDGENSRKAWARKTGSKKRRIPGRGAKKKAWMRK